MAAATAVAVVMAAAAAVVAMGAAGRNVPFLVSTVQYGIPYPVLDMVILISVSDPDPGSIRSMDPYPDSDPGGKK